uniref:Uncharacterized protein n=1 Tax=Peronospora matthiolae TaxID=2874970 RepID=A0AAV1T9E5_9STRA
MQHGQATRGRVGEDRSVLRVQVSAGDDTERSMAGLCSRATEVCEQSRQIDSGYICYHSCGTYAVILDEQVQL